LIADSNVRGYFFDQAEGLTTSKSRLSIGNQQICRIDSDAAKEIDFETENKVISTLNEIPDIGVILLSDYNKGFLTPRLIRLVLDFATERGIAVVADPANGRLSLFQGVTVLKPNSVAFDNYLLTENLEANPFECEFLIVTRGDQGVDLIKSKETKNFRAKQVEGPIDVTGAGDAFAVALAYKLAKSAEIEDSIEFAIKLSALQVTSLMNECLDPKLIKE
jgi:D-beta-D-heptose 7-phosphate kinase/D-beta-D-heptose 1-phosphate adenosyltransferase